MFGKKKRKKVRIPVKSFSAKKKKAPYDNKTELDSATCLHTVPKHITVFFG